MNNKNETLNSLFLEKNGKIYLNQKILDKNTVSESDPSKTIYQIKTEAKKKKVLITVIFILLVFMVIMCFPVVVLALVYVLTENITKKYAKSN